jgi:hypothetical protein
MQTVKSPLSHPGLGRCRRNDPYAEGDKKIREAILRGEYELHFMVMALNV